LFGNRFVTPWPFPDVEPRAAEVAREQAAKTELPD